MINPEVSIGSIVTIATVLLGLSGFYWRTVIDARGFKTDIVDIKIDLKAMNKLMTDVALQNQRLDNLADGLARSERHIDELRRGEGYIRNNHATKA